jgi:hypothetical protein
MGTSAEMLHLPARRRGWRDYVIGAQAILLAAAIVGVVILWVGRPEVGTTSALSPEGRSSSVGGVGAGQGVVAGARPAAGEIGSAYGAVGGTGPGLARLGRAAPNLADNPELAIEWRVASVTPSLADNPELAKAELWAAFRAGPGRHVHGTPGVGLWHGASPTLADNPELAVPRPVSTAGYYGCPVRSRC